MKRSGLLCHACLQSSTGYFPIKTCSWRETHSVIQQRGSELKRSNWLHCSSNTIKTGKARQKQYMTGTAHHFHDKRATIDKFKSSCCTSLSIEDWLFYCKKIKNVCKCPLSVVLLFPGSSISSCGHICCWIIAERSGHPNWQQCIADCVSLHTGRASFVNLQ